MLLGAIELRAYRNQQTRTRLRKRSREGRPVVKSGCRVTVNFRCPKGNPIAVSSLIDKPVTGGGGGGKSREGAGL